MYTRIFAHDFTINLTQDARKSNLLLYKIIGQWVERDIPNGNTPLVSLSLVRC